VLTENTLLGLLGGLLGVITDLRSPR